MIYIVKTVYAGLKHLTFVKCLVTVRQIRTPNGQLTVPSLTLTARELFNITASTNNPRNTLRLDGSVDVGGVIMRLKRALNQNPEISEPPFPVGAGNLIDAGKIELLPDWFASKTTYFKRASILNHVVCSLSGVYKNSSNVQNAYCRVKKPVISFDNPYRKTNWGMESIVLWAYLLPTNCLNNAKFLENCAKKYDSSFQDKSDYEKEIIKAQVYKDFVVFNKQFSNRLIMFSNGLCFICFAQANINIIAQLIEKTLGLSTSSKLIQVLLLIFSSSILSVFRKCISYIMAFLLALVCGFLHFIS